MVNITKNGTALLCKTQNVPKMNNCILTMNQKWCIICTKNRYRTIKHLFYKPDEPNMLREQIYNERSEYMKEILRFIKPELLVLIPVLYFIGIGIKKSNIPNSRIPLLLGLISIFLSTLWVFSTSEINNWQDIANAAFVSITQGILAAGTAVYANQLYIQLKKK